MTKADISLDVPRDCRVLKHSVVIAGHRTSVSLEDAFWVALRDMAAAHHMSVAALIAQIDSSRGEANLSSAIRVTVLKRLMQVSGPAAVEPAGGPQV